MFELKKRFVNKYRRPIKVFWWRYKYPYQLNFGDEITPILIEKLFGFRCEWSHPSKCDMAGAGSIIEILQRDTQGNRCYVWGSGFIKPGTNNTLDNLFFTAVRGESTRKRISEANLPLGDPGLLVSRAIDKSTFTSDKIGLLAHYADSELPIVQQAKADERFILIDPLSNPIQVAKEISECKLVLSSSLHGLIFSDSYSIPNAWIRISDNLTGGAYKFEDYYSATDRPINKADTTRIFDNSYLQELIETYMPVPNLSELQDGLMKSFPYK